MIAIYWLQDDDNFHLNKDMMKKNNQITLIALICLFLLSCGTVKNIDASTFETGLPDCAEYNQKCSKIELETEKATSIPKEQYVLKY